jgi:hypothetical protein
MVGVTRITVGLDDSLAARLAERAARAGLTPEELAAHLLAEDLDGEPADAEGATGRAGFGFFDTGSSGILRGRTADEMLAEGFGQ